jgi:16S rRNA (guanine1516-N2)-methyltransferase
VTIRFRATPDCPPTSHRLAQSLLMQGVITSDGPQEEDLELVCGSEGLTLVAHQETDSPLALNIDLAGGTRGYRQARAAESREDLVRALGRLPRDSQVLDASAGLGRDALVLAAWGFKVVALERNPVLAALLADALERASGHEALRAALARVDLQQGDVREWLSLQGRVFDAAVFDPMFPPRRKDAQVKKDMRVLHRLLGTEADHDAPDTLVVLLRHVRGCVVVKRPLHAPCLGDLKPARSLRGRSTRFDVYLPKVQAEQAPGGSPPTGIVGEPVQSAPRIKRSPSRRYIGISRLRIAGWPL